MQDKHAPSICRDQKVLILYPDHALGQTGVVLEPEKAGDGTETGYWLVRTEASRMILALAPGEFVSLPAPS